MELYLETPHLLLREWKEEDFPPFVRMNQDEQVMEYFPQKLSPEESLAFLKRIQAEFTTSGFGLYAVECKEDHTFIGFVGLHHFNFDTVFAPGVEIGWRLLPEAWGKGYATEAASACLQYAKTVLKLKDLYSFTALSNKRSERVMQKIGMQRVTEFGHPSLPPDHPLYRHILYHF